MGKMVTSSGIVHRRHTTDAVRRHNHIQSHRTSKAEIAGIESTYMPLRDHSSPVDKPLAGGVSSNHLSALMTVLFALAMWVLFMMWDSGKLENVGWIYHDKMTTVYVHNWMNGEYKHCRNINANNHDKPFLMCDDAKLDEEEGKVFDVRFYGRTYEAFDWNCKRSDGSEPMIVCKRMPPKSQ